MSSEFGFIYRNRFGAEAESSLMGLRTVADGPVDLGNGWIGDRVNYDKKNCCFIEFRTGNERTPGHIDNYACEVDEDYVVRLYPVSKEELSAFKE